MLTRIGKIKKHAKAERRCSTIGSLMYYCENENGSTPLKNSLTVSCKIRQVITSNSIPKCLPKRNYNICSHKYLYPKVLATLFMITKI